MHYGRAAGLLIIAVTKDVMTGLRITAKSQRSIYAWTGEKELALIKSLLALQGPGHITYGQFTLAPVVGRNSEDPRFNKLVEEAKKTGQGKVKSQT